MLVFCASGSDDLVTAIGPGYQHPERAVEPLDEYTIMLGFPGVSESVFVLFCSFNCI